MVLSTLSLLADGLPTVTATQSTTTISGDSGVSTTIVDPSLPTSTATIAGNTTTVSMTTTYSLLNTTTVTMTLDNYILGIRWVN